MRQDRSKLVWVIVFILFTYIFCGFGLLGYIRFVPEGNFGDLFSLGQLILDAALLPVAAWGLWMAVEEFRKSRRQPHLYLTWDDEVLADNRELTVYIKRPDVKGNKTPDRVNCSIALNNDGNNVAVWYSISLSFPAGLFVGRDVPSGWSTELIGLSGFYSEHGGAGNWTRNQMPATREEIFQSNGNQACYPEQKITLGTLKFVPVPEGVGEFQIYRIKYKIFTDVGHSRIDILLFGLLSRQDDCRGNE